MSNIIDGASSNGVFKIEQSGGSNRKTTGKDKEVSKIKGRQLLSSETLQPNDQVIFIDSAKRLQAIQRRLREAPAVDKAKVEEIKRRIANGSLEVNADKIAAKLLETDELLG